MKSTVWIIVIAVVVLVVVAVLVSRGDETAPGISPTPTPLFTVSPTPAATSSPTSVATPVSVTVTYSDSGFSPASIRVKKGDSVVFRNASREPARPASAMHPTHEAYPGSSIGKCGGPDETAGLLFDACRAVNPGASWTFRFNEVGAWNYHDHLNSSRRGTVIVEE